VVTNQAGLARGYFSADVLRATNDTLVSQLKDEGAHLDGIYVCPHHPTEGSAPYRTTCDCRKPAPGLLLRAAAELNLELPASTMVGDKSSDLVPARAVGARAVLVLILRFTEREVSLGGAANAAHNVHALGARVLPIGVIGKDGAGDELLALFRSSGIPTDGLVTETGRVTPIKTRIMAGGYQATRQQVVRLDREPPHEPQPITEDALLARLTSLGARADAVIVSDYGYGTVTPRVF